MLLFEILNPNVLRVAKVISCDSGQDFDKLHPCTGTEAPYRSYGP